MLHLGGQVRADFGVVIGWDMAAALAMAREIGLPGWLVVDLLPAIEQAMVQKLREARDP